VTRSDQERFSDILHAIQRCQEYRPYLGGADGFASMAYDAVPRRWPNV